MRSYAGKKGSISFPQASLHLGRGGGGGLGSVFVPPVKTLIPATYSACAQSN